MSRSTGKNLQTLGFQIGEIRPIRVDHTDFGVSKLTPTFADLLYIQTAKVGVSKLTPTFADLLYIQTAKVGVSKLTPTFADLLYIQTAKVGVSSFCMYIVGICYQATVHLRNGAFKKSSAEYPLYLNGM